MHYDIDLGDMILGQSHESLLGHGQQLCEVLSRSNMAVRSYGQDRFWVCLPCDLDDMTLGHGHGTHLCH